MRKAKVFFTVMAIATILPMHLSALPEVPVQRDVVGAYYYPWYNESKWTAHEPQLTPTLGHYLTNDLAVVEQHIDWASYYGVDVFFMSWWKEGELTDVHLKEGYLKASNNNKIKFAMLLEPVVLLDSLDGQEDVAMDFSYPALTEAWIGMFTYFKENYWDHPSYFKIDGKPVVMMYITRRYFNFGPEQVQQLESRVGEVYLMADEAFLWEQADPYTARNGIRDSSFSVFDSYVSYNSYEAQFIDSNETALSYQRKIAMPYYRNWAEHTVFHPPIMPYYQDFRDGHPPLPGTVSGFYDIIRDIQGLPLKEPAGDSIGRIYMVTSWNEWFEGTSIEPSEEVGFDYCEVLRDVFVKQGRNSRPEPVVIGEETVIGLQSIETGNWLCAETADGRIVAGGDCAEGSQFFTLVQLEGDEVAIRNNSSGKYLSVYSDSLLYSLQDYVGTWEIFTRSQYGGNIALQSKKTGTWLRVAPDGSVIASGESVGNPEQFLPGTDPVGIEIGVKAGPGLQYDVSISGRNVYMIVRQGPAVTVTVHDTQGNIVISGKVNGDGRRCLGAVSSNGIYIIQLKTGNTAVRKLLRVF